jgi:small subunit ribosomal protein S6
MEKYELLYILPAKYTQDELSALAKKVKEIVATNGGEIGEDHYMGRRKLAYPIDHVRNGHYYLVLFSAEAAAAGKINETLRLTTEVLRHLIIIRNPYIQGIPRLKEEDSIVQKRFERGAERTDRAGDRGDRGGMRRRPARTDRPRAAAEGESAQAAARQPLETPQEKITMEDLDKKLDKILTDDLM